MVFQILTELRGDFGIAHTRHYFVIHVMPVNHAVLAMNDQLSLTTPMLLHNNCGGCMHAAILAESSCTARLMPIKTLCKCMSMPVGITMQEATIHNFQPLYAEEIRNYFMDHLQAKDESARDDVEGAPDPGDLLSQVDGIQKHPPHHFCPSMIRKDCA